MTQALILLEAEAEGSLAAAMMRGAIALQQVLLTFYPCSIHLLPSDDDALTPAPSSDDLVYPLTLAVPPDLAFPARPLYQRCAAIEALRQQVHDWGYRTGTGSLWLPVVWTARGPLYAEAIACDTTAQGLPYHQPLHLSDRLRQPIYRLAHRVLTAIAATPATYLLQWDWQDGEVVFDRLFPFPAVPAIASLGVQAPDLFTCHGLCLMGQPIRDLVIHSVPNYRLWEDEGWVTRPYPRIS